MADLVNEEHDIDENGSKSDEAVLVIETESKHQGRNTNNTHRCSSNEDNEADVASVSRKSDENEFSIKTSRDDFILRVEDKPLHVNRTLLCLFSSVFDDMLNGEFKDKYSDELALTGKKYGDVLEFLQCLYPNIMKPVTIENVNIVLPLAHEYHVTMLKHACEHCLLRHLSRKEVPEDLYETLEKACYYQLSDVKDKCIDVVSERTHEEYDEAESKFTFSDDVGNKIRKKILQNLNVKYKDAVGHVQTFRALCRFLGETEMRESLLKGFKYGSLVGNSTILVVSSHDTITDDLNVDGIPFVISLRNKLAQFTCKVSGDSSITCLCAVKIRNHIPAYEDKIYMTRKLFNAASLTLTLELPNLANRPFIELTNGFCIGNKFEFQIYLFKY